MLCGHVLVHSVIPALPPFETCVQICRVTFKLFELHHWPVSKHQTQHMKWTEHVIYLPQRCSLYDDDDYIVWVIVHLNRSQKILRDTAMHKLTFVRSCFVFLLPFVLFCFLFIFFSAHCWYFLLRHIFEHTLIFHPISRRIKIMPNFIQFVIKLC